MRVQFFTQVQIDGVDTQDHDWHSTVRCSEYYNATTTHDWAIQNEFDNQDWICPKMDNFTIHNDPQLYRHGNGKSFTMVINECNVAVAKDKEKGLDSYAKDVECNTKEENQELIK